MLFLVGLLVVAAIGGVTFGIAAVLGVGDDSGGGDDGGVVGGGTTSSTVPVALAADQVSVTGVATNLTIYGAVVDEIIADTITVPSAGLTSSGTFEGALVDGDDSTIVWDAGRPLAFAPSTPLRLRPAPVNLTIGPDSMNVAFPDDSVHRVEPGDYTINAPTAVSSGGLGRPMDTVSFTANDDTTVKFTGSASATILPLAMTARGPGQVGLEGTFQVVHPDGTVEDATQIGLPGGSFQITFTPNADGSGYDLSNVILEGGVVVV
jgi:hypothetical protein